MTSMDADLDPGSGPSTSSSGAIGPEAGGGQQGHHDHDGSNLRAARDALETAYKEGVRDALNTSNKQRLQSIAEEYAVPIEKVKRWLYSIRKRTCQQQRPRSRTKRMTAYNAFMSEYLKKHVDMQETSKGSLLEKANAKWAKIKGSHKKRQKYVELAEKVESKSKRQEMNESERCQRAKKAAGRMQSLCTELLPMGYEAMFAISNGKVTYSGGTECGQHYVKQCEEGFLDSLYHVRSEESSKTEEKDELRQRVTNLFNTKYRETMKKGRVNYRGYPRKFLVVGLPEGVPFKKPSSYGRATLRAILRCKNLKFQAAGEEEHKEGEPLGSDIGDTGEVSHRREDTEEKREKKKKKKKHQARKGDPLPQSHAVASTSREQEDTDDRLAYSTLIGMAAGNDTGDPGEQSTDALLKMQEAGDPLEVVDAGDHLDLQDTVTHHGAHDTDEPTQDTGPSISEKMKRKRKRTKKVAKASRHSTATGQVSTEDGMYNVEKILDMKEENGQRCYFILWEGFSRKDATWEPEAHVPANLIIDFMSQRGKC